MLAILFIVWPVAVARQGAPKHAHSVSLSIPHELGFLQKSDSCECTHHGTCSCQGALEFMTCIKNSCESGECRCVVDGRKHFKEACQNMAAGCPDLGLSCADEEATCDEETIGWMPNDDSIQLHASDKQSQRYSSGDRLARRKQNANEDESEDEDSAEDDDLPPGWEKAWSKEYKRYYFANRETGEASWEKPTQPTKARLDDEDADDEKKKKTNFKKEDWVKKHHYKDRVHKLQSHEHHIFAKGIITAVVVLCMTACFALSSNAMVEKFTWSHINAIVVTFLALSWYYVVTHFLEIAHYTGIWKVWMHLAIAMALLLASSLIAWFMQKQAKLDKDAAVTESVQTFNAIFTHMVIWTFAGVTSTTQQLVKPGGASWVLFATMVLMLFFGFVALFWYYAIGTITRKTWDDDRVDALAGAALASGIVLWMHMIVSGSYQTIEDPHPNAPNLDQTMFMNMFGLFYILVACVATPPLKKMQKNAEQSENYWLARFFSLLVIFVAWLPFFSCILSLGHLIVDNLGYQFGAIESRLLCAVVTTVIGFAMIQICARSPLGKSEEVSNVLLELGGKMVGATWSGLLNNSINMMVEGERHPFWDKFQITLFLTAFILPTYFYYLKPLINQKTK